MKKNHPLGILIVYTEETDVLRSQILFQNNVFILYEKRSAAKLTLNSKFQQAFLLVARTEPAWIATVIPIISTIQNKAAFRFQYNCALPIR